MYNKNTKQNSPDCSGLLLTFVVLTLNVNIMMSKGIKKWPIEMHVNNLPDNHLGDTTQEFDLELSISTSHIVRKTIQIGVMVFCYVANGNKRLFEFSTHSKFTIPNPLVEEATLQFIYGCIVEAIKDFNNELSKCNSQLINHPNADGSIIKYPTPSYQDIKPLIFKIRALDTRIN